MEILGRIAESVQALLTQWAQVAGDEVTVIQRARKFTAVTLARTVVLTVLQKPAARWEDFARMAATLGVDVTANGVKHRFQEKLVSFLKTLLLRMVRERLDAPPVPAPLLARFAGVYLGDSTVIHLPEELADEFPGCGGAPGAGRAAVKIQVRLNAATREVDYFALEAGRDCDVKSALQHAPTPRGALVIHDLGYFDVKELAARDAQGVFWISRIQCGTKVWTSDGQPLALLSVLQRQRGTSVADLLVQLGAQHRLPCRLLAVRCPPEVARRRRQKLEEQFRRQCRPLSAERLAWCDWFILVTNLPADQLSWQEAVVLYRSRWQIELLFKLWKSHGLIASRTAQTVDQHLALLMARLIAVLLQQWLLLAGGNALRASPTKGAQIIKNHVPQLAGALKRRRPLLEILEDLSLPLQRALIDVRQRHPSWFQLIVQPELLNWTT